MRCTEARPLFPLYLDSAVTGMQMHAISEHMGDCVDCRSEYKKLEHTRLLVSSLGRRSAPPDLALRIKLSLSHQRSRGWRNILRSYAVRLEDTVNAFMVPATAGVLTAVIFFGAMCRSSTREVFQASNETGRQMPLVTKRGPQSQPYWYGALRVCGLVFSP